jgi:hypothetical protein
MSMPWKNSLRVVILIVAGMAIFSCWQKSQTRLSEENYKTHYR